MWKCEGNERGERGCPLDVCRVFVWRAARTTAAATATTAPAPTEGGFARFGILPESKKEDNPTSPPGKPPAMSPKSFLRFTSNSLGSVLRGALGPLVHTEAAARQQGGASFWLSDGAAAHTLGRGLRVAQLRAERLQALLAARPPARRQVLVLACRSRANKRVRRRHKKMYKNWDKPANNAFKRARRDLVEGE